jgi:hypothetical protein
LHSPCLFYKNNRERDHMCHGVFIWSWSWEHDKFLNKDRQDLTKLNAKASSIFIWVFNIYH